jgi:hypothetical protein
MKTPGDEHGSETSSDKSRWWRCRRKQHRRRRHAPFQKSTCPWHVCALSRQHRSKGKSHANCPHEGAPFLLGVLLGEGPKSACDLERAQAFRPWASVCLCVLYKLIPCFIPDDNPTSADMPARVGWSAEDRASGEMLSERESEEAPGWSRNKQR